MRPPFAGWAANVTDLALLGQVGRADMQNVRKTFRFAPLPQPVDAMAIQLDPAEPAFPIGVAAKLTGLSQKQLRLLEAKQIVTPARTERDRRLYSLEQLNRLRYAAYLITQRRVNAAGVLAALELIDLLPEDTRAGVLQQADQALHEGPVPEIGPILDSETASSPGEGEAETKPGESLAPDDG
jgi:DNA-binding transcriptional MerR regulator